MGHNTASLAADPNLITILLLAAYVMKESNILARLYLTLLLFENLLPYCFQAKLCSTTGLAFLCILETFKKIEAYSLGLLLLYYIHIIYINVHVVVVCNVAVMSLVLCVWC